MGLQEKKRFKCWDVGHMQEEMPEGGLSLVFRSLWFLTAWPMSARTVFCP